MVICWVKRWVMSHDGRVTEKIRQRRALALSEVGWKFAGELNNTGDNQQDDGL